MRVAGAEYNSCLVRCDNLNLKQRILELEGKLELPPSYDPDTLQQEMQQLQVQHQAVQQQLHHVIQQSNAAAATSEGALVVGPGGMLTSPGQGHLAGQDMPAHQPGQVGSYGRAQQPEHQLEAVAGGEAVPDKTAGAMAIASQEVAMTEGDGMGEGLQGVEQALLPAGSTAGLRQRKTEAV